MLGLDIKIRPIKLLGLSITWVYSTLNVTISISFPILSLVSEECHFEHFPLKSSVITDIARLRLLMLFIGISR